ncbi:hypothetical protein NA57DRAFT_79442 [Rhizodiscina lignyota]|uniref:Uncharacterized protein n=1 Tax=Rhizodiscina lignyota TaxID=1504668 RepID=A0A9P4IBX5_9PEZI|nr:hypothetical protein NA57DRAFT_79442 [Rhizodiscina lignyota]
MAIIIKKTTSNTASATNLRGVAKWRAERWRNFEIMHLYEAEIERTNQSTAKLTAPGCERLELVCAIPVNQQTEAELVRPERRRAKSHEALPKKASLLGLPTELRQEILRLALPSLPLPAHTVSDTKTTLYYLPLISYIRFRAFEDNIMAVIKTIRADMIKVMELQCKAHEGLSEQLAHFREEYHAKMFMMSLRGDASNERLLKIVEKEYASSQRKLDGVV